MPLNVIKPKIPFMRRQTKNVFLLIRLLMAIPLSIFPLFTFSVANGQDNVDEEIEYNSNECDRCHLFNEQELMAQIKQARNRHLRAKKQKNGCHECHDSDEVLSICCHAAFLKK